MDRDLIQELADLTMLLIESNQSTAAEITNCAYNTLTDLTKYWKYQEVENPRPESIGQGHRIIIMMKAEIKRLEQELEVAQEENTKLGWIVNPDRMGS